MDRLNFTGTVRLVLAPAACAALLAGCAYEPLPPYTGTVEGHHVSTFDRLDTNRDGFLSRGELEPLGVRAQPVTVETATATFHRYDVNADGFLSRSEAHTMLVAIPGASFDVSDANRDGFLSIQEAMPHLRWMEARNAPGAFAFEAYDIDRDGFLTRAEADPLLRTAQWVNGRWVVAAPAMNFDGLDANRDGFLSRAEAAAYANPPTFDVYDTNRDGFLSRAEADVMIRSHVGATPGAYGGAVVGPRY